MLKPSATSEGSKLTDREQTVRKTNSKSKLPWGKSIQLSLQTKKTYMKLKLNKESKN